MCSLFTASSLSLIFASRSLLFPLAKDGYSLWAVSSLLRLFPFSSLAVADVADVAAVADDDLFVPLTLSLFLGGLFEEDSLLEFEWLPFVKSVNCRLILAVCSSRPTELRGLFFPRALLG